MNWPWERKKGQPTDAVPSASRNLFLNIPGNSIAASRFAGSSGLDFASEGAGVVETFRSRILILQSRRDLLKIFALAATGFMGGCALPLAGPESWDIVSGQTDPENLTYGLVHLTRRTIDILETNIPQIAGAFDDRRGPEAIRFAVGDVLNITIFEFGPGGLFTPPPPATVNGNYVTLPNQTVDNTGNISISYAGSIRAQGRTAVELQKAIVELLKNSALKPQAVVSLVDQRANSFTVLGEVHASGRFTANPSGDRILDGIARAGGISAPGSETWVVLERGMGVRWPRSGPLLTCRPTTFICATTTQSTFIGSRRPSSPLVPSVPLPPAQQWASLGSLLVGRAGASFPSMRGASPCRRQSRRRTD